MGDEPLTGHEPRMGGALDTQVFEGFLQLLHADDGRWYAYLIPADDDTEWGLPQLPRAMWEQYRFDDVSKTFEDAFGDGLAVGEVRITVERLEAP